MPRTEPRQVRPGESPAFGSVWSWGREGTTRYIALTTRRRNNRHFLVALTPGLAQIDDTMAWTAGSAYVGLGPVLSGWWCWGEGPILPEGLFDDEA